MTLPIGLRDAEVPPCPPPREGHFEPAPAVSRKNAIKALEPLIAVIMDPPRALSMTMAPISVSPNIEIRASLAVPHPPGKRPTVVRENPAMPTDPPKENVVLAVDPAARDEVDILRVRVQTLERRSDELLAMIRKLEKAQ